jgi:hypothetical protein
MALRNNPRADDRAPPNLRATSCPGGGPPAEDAELAEPNSPFMTKKAKAVVNPLRVRVRKPDGPTPAAAAAFMGNAGKAKEKPVPVPTPRPDYTPAASTTKAGTDLRGTKP